MHNVQQFSHILYSFRFNLAKGFPKLQEIIQLFYLALASYEVNVKVDRKKFPFKKLIKSTLNLLHDSLPSLLIDMLKDTMLWSEYFNQGENSILKNTEFNHMFFLIFYILESKIVSTIKITSLSKFPNCYAQLIETMSKSPDLLSLSMAVLYTLDTEELVQLYDSIEKLQHLMATNRWFSDYEEAFKLTLDERNSKLEDKEISYETNYFCKYPRAMKVWLIYRLCDNKNAFKSSHEWWSYYKTIYRWLIEQSEKIQKVLHPSISSTDHSLLSFKGVGHFCTELSLTFHLLYIMMEFRYPKSLVKSFCDATMVYLFSVSDYGYLNLFDLQNLPLKRGHFSHLPRKLIFNILVKYCFEDETEKETKLSNQFNFLVSHLHMVGVFLFSQIRFQLQGVETQVNLKRLARTRRRVEVIPEIIDTIDYYSHSSTLFIGEITSEPDEIGSFLIDYDKFNHLLLPDEMFLFHFDTIVLHGFRHFFPSHEE